MDEGFGGDLQQPTISEAQRFRFGGLQAALQTSPSLASCSQYAISDGGLAVALSLPVGGHLCGCVLNERAVGTHRIHSFQNLHRRGICVNFDGSFLSN